MRSLEIAHRGYHRHYPENSLEAFQAAFVLGCDMIEFDVQLTKDYVPVIMHDDDLKRMTGNNVAVWSLNYPQLQNYSLHSCRNKIRYKIPTFREVLDCFYSKPMYIELKVPRIKADDEIYCRKLAEKTAELLCKYNVNPSSLVASFHSKVIEMFHNLFPDLATAVIFANVSQWNTWSRTVSRENLPGYLSFSWRSYHSWIKIKNGENWKSLFTADKILIWGVNRKDLIAQAFQTGVKGVCTSHPEAFNLLRTKCEQSAGKSKKPLKIK